MATMYMGYAAVADGDYAKDAKIYNIRKPDGTLLCNAGKVPLRLVKNDVDVMVHELNNMLAAATLHEQHAGNAAAAGNAAGKKISA